MSTHPIGQRTQNLPVNMAAKERAILGRLAVERDVSISSLIRDMYLAGLRMIRPDVATDIARVREMHRSMILGCHERQLLLTGIEIRGT
jgi:hypothetical protein